MLKLCNRSHKMAQSRLRLPSNPRDPEALLASSSHTAVRGWGHNALKTTCAICANHVTGWADYCIVHATRDGDVSLFSRVVAREFTWHRWCICETSRKQAVTAAPKEQVVIMKKYLGIALVVSGAMFAAPAVGAAESRASEVRVEHHWRRWQPQPRGEAVPSAPELDPGAASQAIALVVGSLLTVRSRRRSRAA